MSRSALSSQPKGSSTCLKVELLGAERPLGRMTRGRKARPSRRAPSFRDLSVGGIPSEEGRGQNSCIDKSLKRPAREAWPPAHRAYAPEGTEEKPLCHGE